MRAGPVAALVVLTLGAAHALASIDQIASLAGGARALNVALLAVEVAILSFSALLLASLRRVRQAPRGELPRVDVDVLVPVRNEPAPVLAGTLEALRRVRAPGALRVLVVDDSDEARAEAIEATARATGASYLRRERRRGYKAGALNDGLRATRAPFVAVLDVDHHPEPSFLEETLTRFAPRVAFVQSIIEWRNDDSRFRRLAALLQRQFYYGVQWEKGARGRAVFAGSAAVFSREALDAMGGFPEETLVEDYDLTLALAIEGWQGRLAPVVGARGLLPWTPEDAARQLWRWSHGTTLALRRRAGAAWASRRLAALEVWFDGLAYLAAGTLVAAGAILAWMSVSDVPVVRPWRTWSVLLAPLVLAATHVSSAAIAQARATRPDALGLATYHFASLAFTPVVLVGALAGFVGAWSHREGRVAKVAEASAPPRAFARLAAGLLCVAGLAAASRLPLAAAGWMGLLSLAFGAVTLVAWPTGKAP